jgi:Undecaprenyl-phosphate glucose phosphotransferase
VSSAAETFLHQSSAARSDHRVLPPVLAGLVALGDAALVTGAGLAARLLSAEGLVASPIALALAALLAVNLFAAAGAYRMENLRQPAEQLARLTPAWGLALLILAGLESVAGSPADAFPPGLLPLWAATGMMFLIGSRLALYGVVRGLERGGGLARHVVVVGAAEHGQRLVERLGRAADRGGVRLIGLFDDRRTRVPHYVGGFPVLGGIDELLDFARRHPVDQVIVALPWDAEERVLACLRRLRPLPVDVRLCPDLIGFHLSHRGVTHLAGIPLLNVFDRPLPGWAYLAKAVEDRVLAALILLLVAPLMLTVAVGVKLSSKGPVLYRQKRYGLNNELIEILKFRTMHAAACDDGGGGGAEGFRQATRGDPRVTPLGRLLRRTSLDELPQFLNVLRGDMSVVGPRPHAVAHHERFAPLIDSYIARHRVKPGITGWAQVHGLRGETDTVEKMERRLEHDLYYIENWSLSLDLRIILRTLLVGFTHPNAY